MKIFWSWQSDLPQDVCHYFVQKALKSAVDQLAADVELEESELPHLDHDTQGEPGWVEIFNTIIKKIDDSAAFVADVSPVATTESKKEVPNPNVLLELGYALKSIGHVPIILVTNTAYGGKPGDVPFDMRHRRGAIEYCLAPGDDKAMRRQEEEKLTKNLLAALRTNLAALLKKADAAITFSRHPSAEGDASIWLAKGVPLEHNDFFRESTIKHQLRVLGPPRSYLRIAPAGWKDGQKPGRDLVWSKRPGTLGSAANGDGGANSFGVVSVAWHGDRRDECVTATQWFQETGEFWGWDAGFVDLYGSSPDKAIGDFRLLKNWSTMLDRCLRVYRELGARPPFQVEVGVVGLSGYVLFERVDHRRSPACDDAIKHVGSGRDWSDSDQLDFLLHAYNSLLNAFARPPVAVEFVRRILQSTPA